MLKYFLILVLFINISYANKLDTKISYNKNILKKEKLHKKQTNTKIKAIANEINKEEKKLNSLNKKLADISSLLSLNKIKLNKSKQHIKNLEENSIKLKKISKETEEKIVTSIVEKYSISLSKSLINKESLSDIINKEKYDIILDNTKNKILKSNLKYFKIQNSKKENYSQIKQLKIYINDQEKQKDKYNLLKVKQDKSVDKLKVKYKEYKNILKSIINNQNNINNLLGNLNILKIKAIKKAKIKKLKDSLKIKKKKKTKKEKNKIKKKVPKDMFSKTISIKKSKSSTKKIKTSNIKIKAKEALKEEIDLDVKKYGSSINGIKISRYRGAKTMAPLKSYTLVKKFGKYYDPVYKIELFNESISLKSKVKNAKVYSVLKGKVVYSKNDEATLGSVVIVKHSHGLHTVYSQLSNIPKSLRVGKWIPKGYVIGRVKDTLVFQATKNSRYINPVRLFK